MWKYYLIFASPLSDFNNSINNFNTIFIAITDQLTILSNKKLKTILLSNWNNTGCRDGLLSQFYDSVDLITYDWNFYMRSLFYISDVDTELSAAFSEVSNFALGMENCSNGNSNVTVACLNQVRIF